MPRKRSVYAIVATALLAVAVGCAPDAETISGPDPQFSKGHAAGGPVFMERFVMEFDDTPPTGAVCAGILVNIAGVDKVVVQVFETHVAVHVNSTATFTNLDNNRFQQVNQTFMQIIHFADGTLDLVGASMRIMLRGEGMLFQDTGIITLQGGPGGEVIFEGGPHEVFADGADICDGIA